MRPLRQIRPLLDTIKAPNSPLLPQPHATRPSCQTLSKTVRPPFVGAVDRFFPSLSIHRAFAVKWCARCNVRIQLDVKSQLIVVHLGGLQETANLHRTLALLLLGRVGRLLPLLGKELRVVARELLQRNEEVSQNNLEPVKIRVGGKQSVNERRDLSTATLVSASTQNI